MDKEKQRNGDTKTRSPSLVSGATEIRHERQLRPRQIRLPIKLNILHVACGLQVRGDSVCLCVSVSLCLLPVQLNTVHVMCKPQEKHTEQNRRPKVDQTIRINLTQTTQNTIRYASRLASLPPTRAA